MVNVFGDDCMHEPGSSINMSPSGSKNSACLDDMPPERVEGNHVIDVPIIGESSVAANVPDAPSEKQGLDKPLTHADRLRKYLKENNKIPVLFRKKDGHPVGKYASVFIKELGLAVKKLAPLQVSGWKHLTEEQKRPIFQHLERAFKVDFSLGPSSVKKETDILMSKRYRDNRQKMHRHYKTLSDLPWEDRLKHVPYEFCKSEADWEFMCKMFESETFKKHSVINSGNKAKVKPTFIYRGGGKSLSQYRYEANAKQIGFNNQDDGIQSLEEVNVAIRARDRVRSGDTTRVQDDLQPAKSTYEITSLIATNAELRSELASTRRELQCTQAALQVIDGKVRILEANQKRLEETIKANTDYGGKSTDDEAVFEKLAFDIAQSLTPPPPRP